MKTISAPKSLYKQVLQFTEDAYVPLELVTENADIKVDICPSDRLESDLTTLFSGGWIKCENARLLAKKLDITKRQMGKLLTELDVKIRQCGLGCF